MIAIYVADANILLGMSHANLYKINGKIIKVTNRSRLTVDEGKVL
jgi:hypothetical protein